MMNGEPPEEAPLTGDIKPREVKKDVLKEAEEEIHQLLNTEARTAGMAFLQLYTKYAPSLGHRRLGRLLSRIYVEELIRASNPDE